MLLARFYARYNAPKPSHCPRCKESDFTWIGGEWVCSNCGMVQSQ
jgi:hypothetical protein